MRYTIYIEGCEVPTIHMDDDPLMAGHRIVDWIILAYFFSDREMPSDY
jgi:hypothetical protein